MNFFQYGVLFWIFNSCTLGLNYIFVFRFDRFWMRDSGIRFQGCTELLWVGDIYITMFALPGLILLLTFYHFIVIFKNHPVARYIVDKAFILRSLSLTYLLTLYEPIISTANMSHRMASTSLADIFFIFKFFLFFLTSLTKLNVGTYVVP